MLTTGVRRVLASSRGWVLNPAAGQGGGQREVTRKAEFVGYHIPADFGNRWVEGSGGGGLLATSPPPPVLTAVHLLSSPTLHATAPVSSVVLFEPLGFWLFMLSFSECDANHSSLWASGVERQVNTIHLNAVVFGSSQCS